jgi:voltage-gated potassium channel Kch
MKAPTRRDSTQARQDFASRSPSRSTAARRQGRLRRWWRRQARPFLRDVQWIAIGVAAAAALVLGYVGFDEHFDAVGESRSFGDTLYLTLQLFALESGDVGPPLPWELEVARVLAPLVAVYAAVSAVAALLREQLELLHMRFMSNHVVVCGLGGRGVALARGFNARGDRVVGIDRDRGARGIGECREEGVRVLIGDVTDRTVLRKARVGRARHLIAVARDDGVNAEVAAELPELLGTQRRRVLTAFVHVIDPDLCGLLRRKAISSPAAGSYRLEFFSIYEIAAPALVGEYLLAAADGDARVAGRRLVVVGLGQLGETIVVHAAKAWRALRGGSVRRLGVTIVDRAAGRKCESLRLRYPRLEDACDLSWEDLDVRHPDFGRARFLRADGERRAASVVYVCVDDDALGLAAARALLPKARDHGVPVVVRMRQRAGLATLLDEEGQCDGLERLQAFPLLDRTCTPELLLDGTRELLARELHEDYVRRHRARGETSHGKPSLADWDLLDERLKESSRRQADHIGVKLRAVGYGLEPLTDWDAQLAAFSPDEVETLAELEHERWRQERLADGWNWGPERDYGEQTHPDLVPWERLAEAEREVDRDAVRGLPSSLAKAGFRVYRRPDADG